MTEKKYKCPTCKKELTKEEYQEILGVVKAQKRELEAQIKRAKEEAKESGLTEGFKQSETQIDLLKNQLAKAQDTIKLNIEKQTTAQLEGFANEKRLATQLREVFPGDEIKEEGKHGDILQVVCVDGNHAGLIVYECKRKPTINKADIRQAYTAKKYRKADYAILVTTGQRKRPPFSGLALEEDVYITCPDVVFTLIHLLRTRLIEMLKANLPEAEREDANRKLAEYLTQGEGNLAMGFILREATTQKEQLIKEYQQTNSWWEERWKSIQTIGISGNILQQNTNAVMSGQEPTQLDLKRLLPLPYLALEQPKETEGKEPTGEEVDYRTEIIERASRRVTGA